MHHIDHISGTQMKTGTRDILVRVRMRIREAHKHMDPTDQDPEHGYIYIILQR
jgi:hypothetical protein